MSAAAEVARSDVPKAELFSLFLDSPVGLAICQSPGKVVNVNPALERMLCLSSKSAQPLSFTDLIHAQDRSKGDGGAFSVEPARASKSISRTTGPNRRPVRWTAWKVGDEKSSPNQVLATG